jgi:hypothetical protein
MEHPAALILIALDRHLRVPADIRLMGGAAMALAYGLERPTEDADLLADEAELAVLAEHCDFGAALEAANAELEPRGLYLSHIWGPEQQILTPGWRAACRPIHPGLGLHNLRASALGPLDLIVSKLCRADDLDLADMAWLLDREALTAETVREAVAQALVPEAFADVFPENAAKLEALLRRQR